MSWITKLIEKMKTDPVYLWDDENQIYVRWIPGKGWKGRYPGGDKEFGLDASSNTITRAFHSGKELTKQEYETG